LPSNKNLNNVLFFHERVSINSFFQNLQHDNIFRKNCGVVAYKPK